MRNVMILLAVVAMLAGTAGAATLKAHWNFDIDATDQVGSNDMTLHAGASLAAGGAFNTKGLSVDNSTNGYADAASNATFDTEDTFSIAMWLKYDTGNGKYARAISRDVGGDDSTSGYNIIFEYGYDASCPLSIRVLHGGVKWYVTTGVNAFRDTLFHVAFAFDKNAIGDSTKKITVWIDGVVDTTAYDSLSGGGSIHGDNTLVLGEGDHSSDSGRYSGIIDDARLYSGCLTQGEVDALQVPEPATMVLLGLGGLGVFLRRRRA